MSGGQKGANIWLFRGTVAAGLLRLSKIFALAPLNLFAVPFLASDSMQEFRLGQSMIGLGQPILFIFSTRPPRSDSLSGREIQFPIRMIG